MGLNLNGMWIEDVKGIKEGVRDFFKNHFRKVGGARPGLRGNLFEKKLSQVENSFLTTPISDSEVNPVTDN